MKKAIWVLVIVSLLMLSTASAQLSVELKRTNPGIAKEKSAELIFEIVNIDMSHKIEAFLSCKSPDDVVITSTYDGAMGSGAQYTSPKFTMNEWPSQEAMSLTVNADSPGDKHSGCYLKYIPFKVTLVETVDEETGETIAVEVKQYLKMNNEYVDVAEDKDYREIRLDKTVPFAPEGNYAVEPSCPEGQTHCTADELDYKKEPTCKTLGTVMYIDKDGTGFIGCDIKVDGEFILEKSYCQGQTTGQKKYLVPDGYGRPNQYYATLTGLDPHEEVRVFIISEDGEKIECLPALNKKVGTCTDSDGGKEYYVKGQATGSNGITWTDRCNENDGKLVETYCNGEYVNFQSYECPNGCEDGACVDDNPEACVFPAGTSCEEAYACPGSDTIRIGLKNEMGRDIEITTVAVGAREDTQVWCSPHSDITIPLKVANGKEFDVVLTCKGLEEGDLFHADIDLRYYSTSQGYEHTVVGELKIIADDPIGYCSLEDDCYDSDGGKNYYVKGTVEAWNLARGSETDECYDDYSVREFYCEGGDATEARYKCPTGCRDGACVKEQGKCIDTDEGMNYYTRGTLTFNDRIIGTDYCNSEGDLNELYCIDDNTGYTSIEYTCSSGCKDGECLPSTKPRITEVSFVPPPSSDPFKRISSVDVDESFGLYGNVENGPYVHYVEIYAPDGCSFENTELSGVIGGSYDGTSTTRKKFVDMTESHNFEFLSFSCSKAGTYTFSLSLLDENYIAIDKASGTIKVLSCASAGEMCAGIAGITCCEGLGLSCQMDGTYPDASGMCVTQGTCTETDSGKDYYTKGTLTFNENNVYTDYCNSEGDLNELYCVFRNTGYTSIEYTCPNGCEDGACIRELSCAKKGEMCGGIASIPCCDGLSCEGDAAYPDAPGTCVESEACIFPVGMSCIDFTGCPESKRIRLTITNGIGRDLYIQGVRLVEDHQCQGVVEYYPEDIIRYFEEFDIIIACSGLDKGTQPAFDLEIDYKFTESGFLHTLVGSVSVKADDASAACWYAQEEEDCDGCLSGMRCLPYGSRRLIEDAAVYCDFEGEWQGQFEEGEACQNSYECETNSCSSGKCIDLAKELEETRNLLQRILDWLKRLFSYCGDGSIDAGEECDGTSLGGTTCSDFTGFTGGTLSCSAKCKFDTSGCTSTPCGDGAKKVLVINFDPIIESSDGQRLTELRNWNDQTALETQYIQDINSASGGYVQYEIVQTEVVDDIPTKEDGFDYTDESYLDCLSNSTSCHHSDTADYEKILVDFNVCEKRNNGEIDEVWIWGGPYFGYYESRLAGPDGFWYNSPPLTGTTCEKQLPIMGFNYERGVSEMIEDMGHRTESVMRHVYGGWSPGPEGTPWDRFTMFDRDFPGQAQCGNVHYAPNSLSDYDWGNTGTVNSSCEDWLNYPSLTGVTEQFDCQRWGCNGYDYKKWWLSHIPKTSGMTDGTLNNWWHYILDYEEGLACES